jgi:putative DNA primase/helicase
MLDFNDNDSSAHGDTDQVREQLRASLIDRIESVLSVLFPAGKRRRGKFLIGDVLGSPGDSLEVVMEGEKSGLWTDRATGDGGDIFALIAAYLGVNVQGDFPRVLDYAADLVGQSLPTQKRKAKKTVPVDELGPATAKWDYFDANGHLLAVVYRYDPLGGKKEFRPWDAKRRKMAPPDPRPLYNQPGMVNAGRIILVEGEKCAQALIAAGITASTAMHGANAPVDKTDWSPLMGKAVLIWPDRDKPGWEYAMAAAHAALAAGALTCDVLMPPDDKADGWDAADALAEGFEVESDE